MSEHDTMVRELLRQRLDTGGTKLPPVDLPPVTSPRRHDVVAWRHDGGLESTRHESKELAFEFARALSWAVVWKYAIMDGRDMIERALVNPPADMNASDVALVIGG